MNKKFFIRLIMLLILMIIIDMGLISINHYSMAWTETGEFSDDKTEGIIYNEFDHSSGNKYLQIRSTSKEMLQQMINQMCWWEYVSWCKENVNTDILGTIYQVEGEDSVYYFSLSNYYFRYMLEHQRNFNSFVFDGDLGDIAELPNFSCWKNVKIITFINYNIDDLTGFDLAYDNGYLKNITDIYFGNSRACEKNDSILKQNKINLHYLTTISSSSERNVKPLKNAAEGCWETIVNGNFNYGVGMVPVVSGQSVRRVDCSSFVSTILYRYGYQGEFLGKQHTTLDFYNTNWNSKYGWREIYVNGGESFRNKGLQAGDIIVRDNGSGKGHMAYVKEVRSDGIPILYDCGDTPHWSKSNINGYTSDSSMAFIDGYSYGNGDLANVGTYPGKIIRIENQYPNNSKNNNSKNNNSKTNNNGNNEISTITYYTLNTVVDLSYADEYSKSKTFSINASLSGGNVNDCEIYVNANRIGNNNGHAEYTIYSNTIWDPINIEIIYNRNGVYLNNTHTYWVYNIDNEGPSSTIWYAFENGKDYMYVKGEDNQELKELRVYDGDKKLINSKSIDNQGYTSYQTRFEVPKNGRYYLIVEDHAGNKTSWGSGYNITTKKPQVIGRDIKKTTNTNNPSYATIGDTIRVTLKFNKPIKYYGKGVSTDTYVGVYLDKYPYIFSKTKNTINVASDTLTFDIKLTADLMDEIELYNETFKNNKCGKLKMSVPGITDYTGNYIDYSNQEIPIYIDYKKPTISTSLKENKSDYKKYEITCKDNYKLKELYINSKKVKTIEGNEGTYELVVKSNGDSKIELVDQAGNVQGKPITTTFSSPKINESTIKKTTNTGYSKAKMNDKIKITTKFNKKIKSVKLVLNDKIEYYKKDNINSNELEVTVTLSQDLVNKLKNNITNIKTSSGGSVYYILEVTDYQGNTVKYDKKSLIDLDYKGPTISVKKRETSTDGSYYQMVHFELGDNFGIKEIYIDGSKKETYSYNSIKSTTYKFKFQEAGNYKIKVVDYAGNATEQSVQVSNKVKVTDFSAINVSNPQSKTAKKGDTIQVTIKLDQKIKSYGRLVQHYYENKTIAIRLDGTYIYRSGIATDVNNKDEITFNIILNDQLLKILKNNHSTSSEIDLRIEVFGIVNLAGIQTDYSNTLPIKIKL